MSAAALVRKPAIGRPALFSKDLGVASVLWRYRTGPKRRQRRPHAIAVVSRLLCHHLTYIHPKQRATLTTRDFFELGACLGIA
eukprot:CAMPEP_0176293476 /NCGR_PEP_ID=MMETSP0121_2-20121125/56630_1 /TAXON_ID=160619 /ORGANISM="Kryptoperidinium foliaceum, Strain CCMP 1326" /LENGTH=82 /DNA_ID=CAMNT_0017634443 /DNA_START=84 /DNA_END=329 /DNA_ORIENTATION=+